MNIFRHALRTVADRILCPSTSATIDPLRCEFGFAFRNTSIGNTQSRKSLMSIRILVVSLFLLPFLSSCTYERFFFISWDEEIKLYDGTIIVVNFNFKHERLNNSSKYEHSILRDTTISFDAGAPFGRITQEFRRMQPVLINRYQGAWYAVITPRGLGDNPYVTGQDWGEIQNKNGQWPLKLTSEGFKTIRLAEFPSEIVVMNLLTSTPTLEEVALNGKLLKLDGVKGDLTKKHPLHPDLQQLNK